MRNLLSKLFITDFAENKEPFLIDNNNRIYTVEIDTQIDTHNEQEAYLFLANYKYKLEESERVGKLESLFLNKNKEKIEQYISDFIRKKYQERLSNAQKERDNLFKKVNDSSIENFIVRDVFREYLIKRGVSTEHPNRLKASQKSESRTDTARATDISLKVPIEEIANENLPVLSSVIEKPAIFFVNRVYSLEPVSGSNGLREFVKIHNRYYSMKYLCDSDEIEDKFFKRLEQRIISAVKKKDKDYISEINRVEAEKEQLQNQTMQININNGETVRYKKEDNGSYLVYMDIPPFIMLEEGQYFKFGKCQIGMGIFVKDNRLNVDGPPQVLHKYHHPFVFSDGDVCYGDRFSDCGIELGSYRLTELHSKNVARHIASALNEGRKAIETGYIDPNDHVRKLSRDGFPEEYISRSEAESSGIRILKQR